MMMLEICEGAHHALKYLCVVQCGWCAWRRVYLIMLMCPARGAVKS